MKAIVQDRFGSADVLELRDIEDPVVGADDVLVQVRAAGCGPDVWHIMTGKPYFCPADARFYKMKAAVRGSDVAGRRGDGNLEGLVRRARGRHHRTSLWRG